MKRSAAYILVLASACATAWGAVIADEGKAREYCDDATLTRVEGIWEFPEDHTRVLIKRRQPDKDCDIIVLSSPDCRLTPGDVIGHVEPTAVAGSYSMSICRNVVKGVLTNPSKCAAKLADNEASLTFEPMKFSFKPRVMYLLPRFWRMFRFNISDPQAEIKQGMVKVYPVPYGSKILEPVYL